MTNKMIKNTLKLGVGSMAGLGAIGAMGNIPNMPANNVSSLASSSMGLANVSNMANIGMNILPKTKTHNHHPIVKKILGK